MNCPKSKTLAIHFSSGSNRCDLKRIFKECHTFVNMANLGSWFYMPVILVVVISVNISCHPIYRRLLVVRIINTNFGATLIRNWGSVCFTTLDSEACQKLSCILYAVLLWLDRKEFFATSSIVISHLSAVHLTLKAFRTFHFCFYFVFSLHFHNSYLPNKTRTLSFLYQLASSNQPKPQETHYQPPFLQ